MMYYYTGAGENDVVLQPLSDFSADSPPTVGFLNGTHQQFDLRTPGIPWSFVMDDTEATYAGKFALPLLSLENSQAGHVSTITDLCKYTQGGNLSTSNQAMGLRASFSMHRACSGTSKDMALLDGWVSISVPSSPFGVDAGSGFG